MAISIKQIIAEILSDGYAFFGIVTKKKPPAIVTDGYYPTEDDIGGMLDDQEYRNREDDEFLELMHMLSAAGVLN